jgi:hypothetical protein
VRRQFQGEPGFADFMRCCGLFRHVSARL